MKKLLLIPLLLFVSSPPLYAETTTKQVACTYPDRMESYKQPLEVTGLKRASVQEFHRVKTGDYNVLWYVVRQKDMYKIGGKSLDDYSVYEYNCNTGKPRRVIWQMTFRKVMSKVPASDIYTDMSLTWIGGNYLTLSLYPENKQCDGVTCNIQHYEAYLWFSPHKFDITEFSGVPDIPYHLMGTYKY